MQCASLKANMGHLEAAAAGAGIYALSAMLMKSRLYASKELQRVNPHLSSLFRCQTLQIASESSAAFLFEGCAFGRVSSFGATGTIAHGALKHEPSSKKVRAGPEISVFRLENAPTAHGRLVFALPFTSHRPGIVDVPAGLYEVH